MVKVRVSVTILWIRNHKLAVDIEQRFRYDTVKGLLAIFVLVSDEYVQILAEVNAHLASAQDVFLLFFGLHALEAFFNDLFHVLFAVDAEEEIPLGYACWTLESHVLALFAEDFLGGAVVDQIDFGERVTDSLGLRVFVEERVSDDLLDLFGFEFVFFVKLL